jgi:hypothetical protein
LISAERKCRLIIKFDNNISFFRKELLQAATDDGLDYEEFTYLDTLFHGFLIYRGGKKFNMLDPSQQHLAKCRSRFLDFLWSLWHDVVPTLSQNNSREIMNIETLLTPEELYYEMADFIGKCVHRCIFLEKYRIIFVFPNSPGEKTLQVPTHCGRCLLFLDAILP